MITFKFRGTIDSIGDLKEGTTKNGKDWKLINFVCDVPDGRYSDKIAMQASGDNADIIAACAIGEEIAVEGYIYAREYNDRYYNNLEASKVYRHTSARPATATPAYAPAPVPPAPQVNDNPDDDLPF